MPMVLSISPPHLSFPKASVGNPAFASASIPFIPFIPVNSLSLLPFSAFLSFFQRFKPPSAHLRHPLLSAFICDSKIAIIAGDFLGESLRPSCLCSESSPWQTNVLQSPRTLQYVLCCHVSSPDTITLLSFPLPLIVTPAKAGVQCLCFCFHPLNLLHLL